jgi:hypothetical protein
LHALFLVVEIFAFQNLQKNELEEKPSNENHLSSGNLLISYILLENF